MVTALNPRIGYDAAAAIANEAFKTGKTVRASSASRRTSCRQTSWIACSTPAA